MGKKKKIACLIVPFVFGVTPTGSRLTLTDALEELSELLPERLSAVTWGARDQPPGTGG